MRRARRNVIVLLFAHGALFLLRTPITTFIPYVTRQLERSSAWLTVLKMRNSKAAGRLHPTTAR